MCNVKGNTFTLLDSLLHFGRVVYDKLMTYVLGKPFSVLKEYPVET